MRIKLSVQAVLFVAFSIVFFLPAYFSSSATLLLNNAVFLLVGLFLFKRKYKPNKTAWLISIYLAGVAAITFLYKNRTVDIHLVISTMKQILAIAFIDYMLRRNNKQAIQCLFSVFLVYVFCDFISVIVYPDGLYFETIRWNEWTSSKAAVWILGNKNNRYIHYLLLLFLASCKYNRGSVGDRAKLVCLCVMAVLPAVITLSSTGLVSMIIAAFGIVMFACKRKDTRIGLDIKWIYLGYGVISVLLLTSNTGFLNALLEAVFDKDMTFSNRSYIWITVWDQIAKQPIFGHGAISSANAQEALGSMTFVNAHNAVLDILWQGGIVALLIVFSIFSSIRKELLLCKTKKMQWIVSAFILALGIESLLEAVNLMPVAWTFILVVYNTVVEQKMDKDSAATCLQYGEPG